jgi:hypothetical protein
MDVGIPKSLLANLTKTTTQEISTNGRKEILDQIWHHTRNFVTQKTKLVNLTGKKEKDAVNVKLISVSDAELIKSPLDTKPIDNSFQKQDQNDMQSPADILHEVDKLLVNLDVKNNGQVPHEPWSPLSGEESNKGTTVEINDEDFEKFLNDLK